MNQSPPRLPGQWVTLNNGHAAPADLLHNGLHYVCTLAVVESLAARMIHTLSVPDLHDMPLLWPCLTPYTLSQPVNRKGPPCLLTGRRFM